MTNLEALKFLIGRGVDITDQEASSYLEFNQIDPSGTWSDSDQSLKCGVYGAALSILDSDNSGITQESEGGYSITYDKVSKAKYLERLANDSGCSKLISKYNTRPKVVDRSNYW
jgi:hypothetical protein